MGIIKLFFIILTCIVVAAVGAAFVARNEALVSVQLLAYPEPVQMSVGKLAAWAFGGGVALGILLCVAYLILQAVQLHSTRRKVRHHERYIETLQSEAKTAGDK